MNRSASRPGSQRFARSRGPETFHRASPGHALRPGTGRAPGAPGEFNAVDGSFQEGPR